MYDFTTFLTYIHVLPYVCRMSAVHMYVCIVVPVLPTCTAVPSIDEAAHTVVSFRICCSSRINPPLFTQLSPLFPQKGEDTLPAIAPPPFRNPGHHFSTETTMVVVVFGKQPFAAEADATNSFTSRASRFPRRDRAMNASEDLLVVRTGSVFCDHCFWHGEV